ncbi:homocysteine S-methyltransferase family protein [Isachenkonia alkalipeptolytica]|uniref:Methionine synthase n=1 Tax=Isachenkonia alkalipeptolytica TaxID=2565777 RepID=A0AA43XK87_9CLOT|nr:homocysteine S-methyltransferase family protein [Isachenkonia alkalipeptolytica]NBG88435.1 homocysteine methyltransferase [Isachenkonia alkalipeptolytica]
MRLLQEDRKKILRYMGHPDGVLSNDLEELLENCLSRVREKVQPKSALKVFPKKELEWIISGKNLRKYFNKVSHGAVFVVTLGEEMERMIEEGKTRSTLEGLAFEAIGSVYTEVAVEDLRQELQKEWEGVFNSFSPGYGDCPLSLHKEILELLDSENHLGIHITKHHLLIPRKTITGVIPLSNSIGMENNGKCDDCSLGEHCTFHHNEKTILFDGGLGTELQRQGFKHVENLTTLNISHPEAVYKAHEAYVKAGSEYLSTNTFGANPLKIQNKDRLQRILTKGIEIAKKAKPKKVFLDIGPLGVLMKPQGDFSFEEAYRLFHETIKIGVEEGVDGILLETFTDLYEIKAAIFAAKEQTDLPVFATMSFEKNGRTFLGLEPKVALRALEAFGADVVGINCSVGPKEIIPWLGESIPYLSKPVMVQGNAGLPIHHKGEDRFPLAPKDYAAFTEELLDLGVQIIGGCCGTGPKTIEAVKSKLRGKVYQSPKRERVYPFTCSYNQGLFIEESVIVGERINPTGKPFIESALRSRNYSSIIQEGILQKKEGADILDINTGTSGVPEDVVLPEVIEAIQQVIPLPLQIDTSNVQALENALRIYNGVPIINSVNGGEESLQNVLPLAKKYGCSIIALTFDEQGIPKTADRRIQIAGKILRRAKALDIPKERIIFDPLALTVAHEPEQVTESLKALGMIKKDLGCKTILGLSNISYGMPQRSKINQCFLTLALYEGLDVLMMDPGDPGMNESLTLFKLLSNQDPQGKNYLRTFSNLNEEGSNSFYFNRIEDKSRELKEKTPKKSWESLLLDGDPREFRREIFQWIKKHFFNLADYENFIEEELLKAFDQIGNRYDQGEVYLPQLIQGAEVLKSGLELINQGTSDGNAKKKGRILLATVEGDLHDIGKNIFRTLVDNYGYFVKDLGKDVKTKVILEEMEREEYLVVGLSALMTTTLGSMEKTIRAIKNQHPECKIIVGGAVLTEDYARELGADAYAKDAREGVHRVKTWLL